MFKGVESYNNGKVIVLIETEPKQTTPLFCPVCEFPMKAPLDDAISFQKYGCCSKCDQRWTNFPGLEKWLSSKHPSEISKEFWDEYIEERRLFSRPLLTFK